MFNRLRERSVSESEPLLNDVQIRVSDTKSIINNEEEDMKNMKSNGLSTDGELGCYINPDISSSEEILVNNNNYGAINSSNTSVKSLPKLHIDISRDVIDFDDLNKKYGKRRGHSKDGVSETVRRKVKDCCRECSPFGLMCRFFPILNWIRSYSLKEYLINDLIAGFTILILHIPQGMAYGMLAGLTAINGLYVSFFPVLVYSLMGTSRHLSIGTFAIISIMSSNAAEKLNAMPNEANDFALHFNSSRSTFNATHEPNSANDYTMLEVLTSLCILTGIFQFLMGVIQLGVLSVILSDTLVSAFSTGCSMVVATSQMSSLFDIKLPKNEEHVDWLPFKLINQWISIFKRLGETNLVTLGFSAFGIILLIVVKELVEPRIKKRFKLNVPLPIDLMLVILFTYLSWQLDLKGKHGVDIMGKIPTGLPNPQLPRLDLLPNLIIDSLVIAIVAFAVSLSLGKIFAKKHKYKIDANQELIALGTANIFSSLFACYPCSASLSRSSVQERTGGKTQVAGLVSSLGMLVFLLFLGPLLYNLPKTTLSCIILVALKSMFLQFSDFVNSWRISKLEAIQWLVTFIGVVLLGVDIGLIVGVLFSLVVVLLRFTINEIERLKEEKSSIHTIILDFSSIFFIDSTGIETIIEIISELDEFNIKVILCQCSQSVIQMMDKMKFFTKVQSPHICATVHDAVIQSETTIA